MAARLGGSAIHLASPPTPSKRSSLVGNFRNPEPPLHEVHNCQDEAGASALISWHLVIPGILYHIVKLLRSPSHTSRGTPEGSMHQRNAQRCKHADLDKCGALQNHTRTNQHSTPAPSLTLSVPYIWSLTHRRRAAAAMAKTNADASVGRRSQSLSREPATTYLPIYNVQPQQ